MSLSIKKYSHKTNYIRKFDYSNPGEIYFEFSFRASVFTADANNSRPERERRRWRIATPAPIDLVFPMIIEPVSSVIHSPRLLFIPSLPLFGAVDPRLAAGGGVFASLSHPKGNITSLLCCETNLSRKPNLIISLELLSLAIELYKKVKNNTA
jgi:hypothetical protein